MATKTASKQAVSILDPNWQRLRVPVKGVSPGLMTHRWSEKARKMIADGQAGPKVKKAKEARDPEAEFLGAIYHFKPGRYSDTTELTRLTKATRYGFPANAFKKAMVRACKVVDGVAMADARICFFVVGDSGDLVEIKTDELPTMQTDSVRIGMGKTTLAYRPLFTDWTATLTVEFDGDVFQPDDIINLIKKAGIQVGVGERRPEKEGNTFGRWTVLTDSIELEEIEL